MKKITLLIGLLFYAFVNSQNQTHIIPQPVSLKQLEGSFVIDANTNVIFSKDDHETSRVVHFFKEYIKKITGFSLQSKINKDNTIYFITERIPSIGEEGYLITVNTNKIFLKANTPKGLFYGVQSLLQTLPAIRTNDLAAIPCMEIKDYPRFKWRGLMLDVSRHFFSVELIKEFIDLMATYKLNVFHWHLVDGPGWRLEIKKYPKLTQLAAWRVDETGKTWNWSEVKFNADRNKSLNGGYYTQEQAKEIVAYALERNISVVPEIEMPGHSEAAMAAYPEISCNPIYDFSQSGNFLATKVESNYCAGNDQSFVFLENVLNEVLAIFPSKYIHIGGDEVNKSSWKKCNKCQNRMQVEHLKDEKELQSYFIRRIEKFLASKNRKIIGWDEILEGGLAPEATVMSWRGEIGGIEAAKMGHDVIMTPDTPCYFDYYQGNPETEPVAIGGFNTLKKVYHYEPIPTSLNDVEASKILGSQANLWTEYIFSPEHAEYMILPRLPALAEVLWSTKAQRNWQNFKERLKPHLVGYDQKGMHYSEGNTKVEIKKNISNGINHFLLETENSDATIFYTTDGSTPTKKSNLYVKPFEASNSMTVKAIMVLNDKIMSSKANEQIFTLSKSTGKDVVYEYKNSTNFPANGNNTLTDGLRGSENIETQWHGFIGSDMVATIHFDKPVTATQISLGTIQNKLRLIFLPEWVRFETSEDGILFKEIKTIINDIPVETEGIIIKDFSSSFTEQKLRAIRIVAKNIGPHAMNNSRDKQPVWLFVDEIIVE